jgi:HAD superfamily hydrolase (TIGR01662 family)
MIHAILLDLDDTLLINDIDRFLPPYFAALGRRMARFAAPDDLTHMILKATRAMLANQDPTITNQQAFDADFFPALGYPEAEVRPLIHAFYEDDFPALKRYTERVREARPLVEILFDEGYDVAIATNPMFPRRAIEHRLNWAGVLDFPFNLVTTYENSHFCKPNPRYYLEILEKLACPPGEAIMIGDDFGNDIQPALKVGLHTYWITEGGDKRDGYSGLRGSLTDCLEWVQSGGLHEL